MKIEDLQLFENNKYEDARGSFERVFDDKKLLTPFNVKQVNLSINPKNHTLRGMHYQVDGPEEDKYVTVISGSAYLAVIDLRKHKSTYLNIFQKNFSSQDRRSILIPSGCATGWITLEDNSRILYQMSARFEECKFDGIRYNDPAFSINWPELPKVISEKDLSWPNFVK